MLPISPILFPVDFSERCSEMIPYAELFASKYRAELIVLHVVNPVITIPETGLWPSTSLPVPEWLITEQADKRDAFGQAELDGFPVKRLVYEGEPEAQIVATANAENVQLVILPTHGYGKFRRFLIGSITAKVLHDLECPILTGVHLVEPAGNRSSRIANVVCALDLGSKSSGIMTWASRISCDFHAGLSIVHAIPRIGPNFDVVFSSDWKQQMEASIRDDIKALQTTAGLRNTTVCIEEGETAHTVCSYAKSVGADLLVIGRGHANSGFGLLRDTAYAIIRESPCPVLSV